MDSTRLKEGMVVYGSHGEKLGKVAGRSQATFVIEKGTFFRKDYVARYEDVAEISGDEVRLAHGEEALGLLEQGAAAEGPLGEVSSTGAGGGAETISTAPAVPPGGEVGGGQGERDYARAARQGEGERSTVTYGAGEDSGATQARRDEPGPAGEPARGSLQGRTPADGAPPSPTRAQIHREAREKIVQERGDHENEAANAPRRAPPAGPEPGE